MDDRAAEEGSFQKGVSDQQIRAASDSGGGQRRLGPSSGQRRSLKKWELEFIFSFTFYLERRNNVVFHTVTEQREPSLLQNLQS